ncbi:hypothetical protein FVE85_3377 [Porphyridium purpureum]|uniref:Uncharacterized protein n=1 Tax=Porphyridium purpureum TaxID=35688 RepID=A0A5J4YUV6_PORPP|nr:hypothetical protein FVE85_3377 [Porphyridium purpureum]|eukprot:POR2238..scf227_4
MLLNGIRGEVGATCRLGLVTGLVDGLDICSGGGPNVGHGLDKLRANRAQLTGEHAVTSESRLSSCTSCVSSSSCCCCRCCSCGAYRIQFSERARSTISSARDLGLLESSSYPVATRLWLTTILRSTNVRWESLILNTCPNFLCPSHPVAGRAYIEK